MWHIALTRFIKYSAHFVLNIADMFGQSLIAMFNYLWTWEGGAGQKDNIPFVFFFVVLYFFLPPDVTRGMGWDAVWSGERRVVFVLINTHLLWSFYSFSVSGSLEVLKVGHT